MGNIFSVNLTYLRWERSSNGLFSILKASFPPLEIFFVRTAMGATFRYRLSLRTKRPVSKCDTDHQKLEVASSFRGESK